MNEAAPKRFLSRKEVSEIFEVSPHTVTRWAKAGKLPCVLTPAGRRRYLRDDVLQLLEGAGGGSLPGSPNGSEEETLKE